MEAKLSVVDFDGATLATSIAAGDRIWFKNTNTIYFPGEVQSVTLNQSLPTYLAANGGSAYTGALKIAVSPGFRILPPTIWLGAGINLDDTDGGSEQSDKGAIGTLTTQADTNPIVQVHVAEVRRLKRVSYDG